MTGTPATGTDTPDPERDGKKSSDEIVQDIRRTRGEMSETLGSIEQRLAPTRLKREFQDAVHETIDEVKHRFHPRRIANRAGRNMLETIKDNPVPAAIAGLSVGYLFMKGGKRSLERRGRDGHTYERYRRRSTRPTYAGRRYYPEEYYEEGYYEEEEYRPRASGRRHRSDHDEGSVGERASEKAKEMKEGAKERASETAREVQERASEQVHRARERASERARQVQHSAERTGRRMQRSARRMSHKAEEFVYTNPMAAGALAAGVGALLGNLFPSTRTEDEWMGPMRDEVTERAEDVAEETMHEAKHAAERVGEEAKEAAEDVKETAKTEAKNVKEETKREAEKKTNQ